MSVQVTTATVETVVKTEVKGYTITLTEDEAITLGATFYRVGGMPEGYRGHIEDMLDGLREAGLSDDAISERTKHIMGNGMHGGNGYGAIYFDGKRD